MTEQKRQFLKRTESSFTDNTTVNRGQQIRRDDDNFKNVKVSIEDIDSAFNTFMVVSMEGGIHRGGQSINIPVQYASPEAWVSAQRQGFIRDDKGRIITPLVAYRKTSMTPQDDYMHLRVRRDDNKLTFQRKYTSRNRYDKFSVLSNQKPVNEMYSMDIPEYVEVSYEISMWADTHSELNQIIQKVTKQHGRGFGDRFKFVMKLDSISFDETFNQGENRIIRANSSFTVRAYLISEHHGTETNIKKHFSVAKIEFGFETDNFGNVFETGKHFSTVTSAAVGKIRIPGTIDSIGLFNQLIQYIDSNASRTAAPADITSSTATFRNIGIKDKPSLLTGSETSKNDFLLFVNGQYINHDYWSVAEVLDDVVVTVNVAQLNWGNGVGLEQSDEVTLIGKFDL